MEEKKNKNINEVIRKIKEMLNDNDVKNNSKNIERVVKFEKFMNIIKEVTLLLDSLKESTNSIKTLDDTEENFDKKISTFNSIIKAKMFLLGISTWDYVANKMNIFDDIDSLVYTLQELILNDDFVDIKNFDSLYGELWNKYYEEGKNDGNTN